MIMTDNTPSSGSGGAKTAVQDPALLRRLLRARDRMDAASHEDWPVTRLALVSGVSAAHFARSFREAFGVPPHRYLLTRRLERVTALLRDTQMSITEIAFLTGWSSFGNIRAHRSRRYRQSPEPIARRGEARRAPARPGPGLRSARDSAARPENRSFGEAAPGRGG